MRCILRTVGAGVLDSPAVQSNNRKKVRRIPSSCEIAEPFCYVPICCRATLVVARFASRSRHGFASRNGEEGTPPCLKGGGPSLRGSGGYTCGPVILRRRSRRRIPTICGRDVPFFCLSKRKVRKKTTPGRGRFRVSPPPWTLPHSNDQKGLASPFWISPGFSGER